MGALKMFERFIQTPLGEVRLRSDGEFLTGLWFVGQVDDAKDVNDIEIQDDLPIFGQVESWLESYFSGKKTPIMIPLQPKGTIFQERVWQILQEIPYGETMTYGEIAQIIAKEKGVTTFSAQAVGQAVGKNPISILVPCHRVVGKNGALTGYAGGIQRKEELLNIERGK
jgi:methylated-DNA--[protein]-cysteine S-methyltransferase